MSWGGEFMNGSYSPTMSTARTETLNFRRERNTAHPKKNPLMSKSKLSQKTLSTLSTATTMSGLPLKVRHRLDGKLSTELSSDEQTAPVASYIYTYGLSKEEEEQFQSGFADAYNQSPSSVRFQGGQGLQPSNLLQTPSGIMTSVSGRLREVKNSFRTAEISPKPFQPSPYFQNWGGEEGSAEGKGKVKKEFDEDEPGSGKRLYNWIDEGLKKFEYIEGMDKNEDDAKMTAAEREEAIAAFRPPEPTPSPLHPKIFFEVGNKSYLSQRSMNVSVRSMTPALSSKPSRTNITKSRKLVEPNPTRFIKPPPLHPSHRQKIVDKQLQRELSNSPMTHEEYSQRKRELMEAALRAYDREIPTYEAIPDIRDEIMEADERKKAISRNNVMDLVYHALTNQSASISMKSPSTGLHLSSANFTEREKYQQPRALDQFHGGIASSILKEVNQARANGLILGPNKTHNAALDPSKEKLKALRALENYDLTKLRQRVFSTPKPVLMLRKMSPRTLSTYTSFGGSFLGKPTSQVEENVSTDPQSKTQTGNQVETSIRTTTGGYQVSSHGLKIQREMPKPNHYMNGRKRKANLGPSVKIVRRNRRKRY